jgi:hypothetical protein
MRIFSRYAGVLLSLAGLSLLFFFLRKSSADTQLPLEQAVVVDLLTDLHLAENAAQELLPEVRDSMKKAYFQRILADHKVSAQAFNQCVDFLNQHPDQLQLVYALMQEKLVSREVAGKTSVNNQ